MSFSIDEIPAGGFENESPQDCLKWAFEKFGQRIALASSFGIEDVVLIDMAMSITSKVRVFTLDTGRLHQESYDLMDRIRNRYGIKIETMFPDAAEVENMVTNHGINLFYDSVEKRRLCCGVRKIKPLRRILSSLDAWVVGLRRDQNVTRTSIRKVSIDHANYGIVKISPLADWTNDQVREYQQENKVPYNKLHDQGFPSIGCEPCTRPIESGDDPRAGRWWWENSDIKECGLHPKS
ncbi:MAG TPA: phosphoadenylyl-sulfate reductase [Myxococcales bacterium]|nr:phosphoadenylyl-sulfate reductase [Myxococcales bacterium]HIN85248.1 phosphoadenylyl-sulfate reductase [Myxococcales bacterium]